MAQGKGATGSWGAGLLGPVDLANFASNLYNNQLEPRWRWQPGDTLWDTMSAMLGYNPALYSVDPFPPGGLTNFVYYGGRGVLPASLTEQYLKRRKK